MTKVRKITARGTGIREAELKDQNWSVDAYRKVEQEKLKKAGKDITMHLGRGVITTKSGDPTSNNKAFNRRNDKGHLQRNRFKNEQKQRFTVINPFSRM